MICEKCHASLEGDALFCHVCGDQFAANKQKEKVNSTFLNTRNIILKNTKSPLFLVVAILFSVIFAFRFFSTIRGGISEIFSGILPCVFMGITVYGLWSCYAAKKFDKLADSLRKASVFEAYTRVMHTISVVLLSILGVASVILVLFMGAGAQALNFAPDAISSISIISAIIVFVVFAVIITIVLIFRSIYAKRRKFFLSLSETVRTCNYTTTKAPVVGSYVLGGFDIFGALLSISVALSARAVVNQMFGPLLAEMGIADAIDAALVTISSGLVVSAISNFISGGYLVISAVWMLNMHKAEVQNKAEVMEACAVLEKIEKSVREIIMTKKTDEESAEAVEISLVEEITVEEAVVRMADEEVAAEGAENIE